MWIVEHGIGEARAALIEDGAIVEARIEPHDSLRAGTVAVARLLRRIPARGEGVVAWDGHEAILRPVPASISEGATLLVEVTRPALPEPGKPKRARVRPAAPDAPPGLPPPLEALLPGARVATHHDPDRLEDSGWSALLEEAATRQTSFVGGALSIAPTPAMTLIDIDGEGAPAMLAVAGAAAAAQAVRRLDIAGSIGIDLPSVPDRTVRQRAAEAVDAALPQPFERTAVNGFGFLQIVRRRSRMSLVELYAADPVAAHARALLRRIERSGGSGERDVAAHPSIVALLTARPEWIATAARHAGAAVALRADPALAISAGHVQARFP